MTYLLQCGERWMWIGIRGKVRKVDDGHAWTCSGHPRAVAARLSCAWHGLASVPGRPACSPRTWSAWDVLLESTRCAALQVQLNSGTPVRLLLFRCGCDARDVSLIYARTAALQVQLKDLRPTS